MVEKTALVEKREEIRRIIATGYYKTLMERFLDYVGLGIQKLTRSSPPPFWVCAFAFELCKILLSIFITILLDKKIINVITGLVFTCGVSITVCLFIIMSRKFWKTFAEPIIDHIESVSNIADLQQFGNSFRKNDRKVIIFTVALVCLYFVLRIIYTETLPGIGYLIIAFISLIQITISLFGFPGLFIIFTFRLRSYHFKLYHGDPSGSECIENLSDIINFFIYTLAIYSALSTFFFIWGMPPGFPQQVLKQILIAGFSIPWILGIIMSLFYHSALSKIIKRDKWKTLNAIQDQAKALQNREKILSDSTIASLNTLMDYHNRIKKTPNSAINTNAIMTFVKSLGLPLLGSLLAYLKQFIAFLL